MPFERDIFQILENLKRQIISRPLNLGGVYASGGGNGGPPGGFIGVLPQTRVAYDLTEAAVSGPSVPPPSGYTLSLLDNLNHIRYRLGVVESGISKKVTVYDDAVLIGSGITNLNFGDNLHVVASGSDYVTIHASGGQDIIAVRNDTALVASGITTLDFTGGVQAELTDTDYITIALHTNKIIRKPPDGTAEEFYPVSVAGLTSALADCTASYNIIYLPNCSLVGNFTVPADTKLIGIGSDSRGYSSVSFLRGQITYGDGVSFKNMELAYYAVSDSAIYCLTPGGGDYYLYLDNCYVYCNNYSSGASANAYIVYHDGGNGAVYAWETEFQVHTGNSSNVPYLIYVDSVNPCFYYLVNCKITGDSATGLSSLDDPTYSRVYNMIDNRGSKEEVLNYNTNFVVVSGISKLGNYPQGNYANIAENGIITLYGNAIVYDDLQETLIDKVITSPSVKASGVSSEGTVEFANDSTLADYVSLNVQLSRRWDLGTKIYPQLHWWQISSNVPNWLIQYRWQRQGYPKITAWSGIPYLTNTYGYTSGTLNQIATFSGIAPPINASAKSDIIQIRLLRDTNNDSSFFGGSDPSSSTESAVSLNTLHKVEKLGISEV